MAAKKVLLRALHEDQKIMLRATEGTGTFARSGDIYTGYLDSDFESWNLDGPGKASPEMQVSMKEMVPGSNGKLADIFAAIGEIEKLVVPQEQAKNLAVEHRDKLHPDGWATFVPFTRNDEPVNADKSNVFVASVYADGGELKADVYEFLFDYVWRGGYQPLVVFRQQ